MGDDYQLYFLEDQQNKPVAVVLRKDATQDLTPALPEVCVHAAMDFMTPVTTLLIDLETQACPALGHVAASDTHSRRCAHAL